MLRTLLFLIFNFIFSSSAYAKIDPTFFQIGPAWREKINTAAYKIQQAYDPGYLGEPIVDKHGKLVVFEGPEVSREDAIRYVDQYNKTH